MRFLLDVCVSSRSLEAFLVARGHDVVSAISIDPRAGDQQLLDLALREDRVLITEDKDFGELVFVRGLPHGPIVRVVELTVDEQVAALGDLLDQYAAALGGPVLITVTPGRIRIRRRRAGPRPRRIAANGNGTRRDLPHSEAAAASTLALPIYPELTDDGQRHVVQTLADYYRQTGRPTRSRAA